MARATEFLVTLENKPGKLAEVAEVLGNAGVNIEGMVGRTQGSEGVIALVTDNPNATGQAFEAAGVKHTTKEVLLLKLENKPGTLARVSRAMADANINIESGYILIDGRVALDVSDIASAEEVARNLDIL